MTSSRTALTAEPDSRLAGLELGGAMRAAFDGAPADAVVVFSSAQHDHSRLLAALSEAAGTAVIVGSSSAGEFTHAGRGEGYVSALGLRSRTMRFAVGVGRELSQRPREAARRVVDGFAGDAGTLPHRAALVMTDALAGHTDALIEELTLATGGDYRFFGGGAGDDGRFHKTHVFAGTEAISDAVVALEILSSEPLGIGVSHGWLPASAGLRVTEVDGMRLVGLNGAPAAHAFAAHAQASGQRFDPSDPLPFFLHNVLGIRSGDGFRLRVPLALNADGSVVCAAAIPEGAIVHIMETSAESAVRAAERATQAAMSGLNGRRPAAALVFDCVATRLRMGRAFDDELRACADLLGSAGFVGCNTYGQIARAEGQFAGFHNCTAVVAVLPE